MSEKSKWQEMMERLKTGPFSILSDRALDEIRWMIDEIHHDAYERGKRHANADTGLTFAQLHAANVKRIPLFKNSKGEPCHNADGSNWALSAWSNAMAGEAGETCNVIKKIERGDKTLEEAREHLGEELADVAIYLSILAYRAGIDLGEAVRGKFNSVSEKIGVDVKL